MIKKILFQGDSVTDVGRSRDTKAANTALGSGYVARIASELLYKDPSLEIYNRGVSGNRIGDMYARWIEDTLNIAPDLLSVLNGINDVGFGLRLGMGSDAARFEYIYDRCLYEAKEQNPALSLVLIEPFILRVSKPWAEFGDDIYANFNEWHTAVRGRAEVCRRLAEKYEAVFVSVQDKMDEACLRAPAEHWSLDCIHPTHAGAELLAREWLKATSHLLSF